MELFHQYRTFLSIFLPISINVQTHMLICLREYHVSISAYIDYCIFWIGTSVWEHSSSIVRREKGKAISGAEQFYFQGLHEDLHTVMALTPFLSVDSPRTSETTLSLLGNSLVANKKP